MQAEAWSERNELAILGAVMFDGEQALDRVELDESAFYHLGHRRILRAMRRLRAAGKPCNDPGLIADELGEAAMAVGVFDRVIEGAKQCAAVGNLEHYVGVVARDALTRKAKRIVAELASCELQGEELVAKILEGTTEIAEHALGRAGRSLHAAAVDAYRELARLVEESQSGGTGLVGIPTGYRELDFMLGGLQRGVLSILGGRPSMGKSALARNIGVNAIRQGLAVHFFSVEDSEQAFTRRVLSELSGVPMQKFKQPKGFTTWDLRQLMGAVDETRDWRFWVDDATGLSSAQIAMRVRRRKRELGTDLVIVDYMQLVREEARDRRLEVEKAAEGLVQLARREGLAVLAASQLSRAAEGELPRLSDLRETGALEQLADAVLAVHRPARDSDLGQVLVLKNKHGATGTVELEFRGSTTTWYERRGP